MNSGFVLLILYTMVFQLSYSFEIDSVINKTIHLKTQKSSKQFEDIIKSKIFIDNTFLIKDLFSANGTVKLITAPRRFGKSTNLNMVKSFLEITVDEHGNTVDIFKTKNFQLYKSNDLNICKDKQFFEEYFGKYPVVYIDYNPLRNVCSFTQLLDSLRIVISQTFSEHEYLMRNENLWMDDEEISHFQNHIITEKRRALDKFDITFSFQYLALLLKKHFRKKVFVLIDNCDAFVYNMIFKDSPDMQDILHFMEEMDGALLTAENLVSGALLTGVLRVFRGPWGANVWSAQYLQEVEFSKYYGLTEPDLLQNINTLLPEKNHRLKVKSYLDENFGGYRLYNDGQSYVRMYSIESVIRYLQNETHITDYLCYPEYSHSFKSLFKIRNITEVVEELLAGKDVEVDLYEAFYKEHFLAINNMLKHHTSFSDYGVEWVLRFLHRFGYLTPVDENKNCMKGKFKVPNKEVSNIMQRFLTT